MSTSTSDRPRGPRWLNPLAWVLVPVAVVAALEVAVGRLGFEKSGYTRVERIAHQEKIDLLFIGTSRTWAGVHPDVVAAQAQRLTGRRVRAVRAGIGNSTNAQHLRGLRNVLRAVPGAFEGTDVFIEARAGVPGAERGPDLRNDLGPGALEDVFRLEDLPELLRQDLGAEAKASALVAWAAPPSRILTFRSRLRRKFLARLVMLARNTGRLGAAAPQKRPRFAAGGGIRDDAAGVAAVRATVTAHQQDLLDRQRPIPWGAYDLLAIVDLLQENGARVFVLRFPICTQDGVRWRSDVRRADARRIAALLAPRGVAYVAVPLEFPDESFPDNIHLDLDAAGRFSRGFAAVWARLPR